MTKDSGSLEDKNADSAEDPALIALQEQLNRARLFFNNPLFYKAIQSDIQNAYALENPDAPPLTELELEELVKAEVQAFEKARKIKAKEIEADKKPIDPLKVHSFPTMMQLDNAALLINQELEDIAKGRQKKPPTKPKPAPVQTGVSGLYRMEESDFHDSHYYFAVQTEDGIKIFYHTHEKEAEKARQQMMQHIAKLAADKEKDKEKKKKKKGSESIAAPSGKESTPATLDPVGLSANVTSIETFADAVKQVTTQFGLLILEEQSSFGDVVVERLQEAVKIYNEKYATILNKGTGLLKASSGQPKSMEEAHLIQSDGLTSADVSALFMYSAGAASIVAGLPTRVMVFIEGYKMYKAAQEALQNIELDIKEGRIAADSTLTAKKREVAEQLMSEGNVNMALSGLYTSAALAQLVTSLTSIVSTAQGRPITNAALRGLQTAAPGALIIYQAYTLNQQAKKALDIKEKLTLASSMFDYFSRNFPDPVMPEVPAALLKTPAGAFLQEQKSLGMELSAYFMTKLQQDYESTLKGGAVTFLDMAVSANGIVQSALVKSAMVAAGITGASITTAGAALGAVAIAGCIGALVNFKHNKDLKAKRKEEESMIKSYDTDEHTYDGMMRRLYVAIKMEAAMSAEISKHQAQNAQKQANKKSSKFENAWQYSRQLFSSAQTNDQNDNDKEHDIGFPTDVVIGTHSRYSELLALLGMTPEQFIAAVDEGIKGYEKVNNEKIYEEKNAWVKPYEDALRNRMHLMNNEELHLAAIPDDKMPAKLNIKDNQGNTVQIRTTNPSFSQRCVIDAVNSAHKMKPETTDDISKKEKHASDAFQVEKNLFLSNQLVHYQSLINAHENKVKDVIKVMLKGCDEIKAEITKIEEIEEGKREEGKTEEQKKEELSVPISDIQSTESDDRSLITTTPEMKQQKSAEGIYYRIELAVMDIKRYHQELTRMGNDLKQLYESVKRCQSQDDFKEKVENYQKKQKEFNALYKTILTKSSHVMKVIEYNLNDLKGEPNKRNLDKLLIELGAISSTERMGKKYK